jgi:exodeoxyribonuclease V alpha subunit
VADARRQHEARLARFGPLAWTLYPAERLADTDRDIATARTELNAVRACIARLTSEPALLAQSADQLARERDHWRARHDPELATTRTPASRSAPPQMVVRPPRPEDVRRLALHPDAGLGMPR